MTTDEALRRDLIESSRQRALGNRARLSQKTPIWLAGGFAAGLLLAWLFFGRKRGLATTALFLVGGAWLAARWLSASSLESTGPDRADDSSEPRGSPIDAAGRDSFPASDAPAHVRRTAAAI